MENSLDLSVTFENKVLRRWLWIITYFYCSHCNGQIKEGEIPFKCSQCDKTFASSEELNIHEEEHSSENQFGCSTCDKTFLSAHDMNTHQENHPVEKERAPREHIYSGAQSVTGISERAPSEHNHSAVSTATENSDTFISEKNHSVAHSATGISKRSSSESSLSAVLSVTGMSEGAPRDNNHENEHQNAKPFACSQCNKKFDNIDNLVNKEEPRCPSCNKIFAKCVTKSSSNMNLRKKKN